MSHVLGDGSQSHFVLGPSHSDFFLGLLFSRD